MTGYGKDQIEVGNTGQLHAGTNFRIDQISELQGREFFPKIQVDLSNESVEDGSFWTLSARKDSATIKKTKGSSIEEVQVKLEEIGTDHTALVLEGDSGGPAIGFDSLHHPFVVGIAAHFRPDVSRLTRTVFLVDANNQAVTKGKLPSLTLATEGSDLLEGSILTDFYSNAEKNGWIDLPNKTTLQDFSIVEMVWRLSVSVFTSTTSEMNSQWIQKTLSELESLRK